MVQSKAILEFGLCVAVIKRLCLICACECRVCVYVVVANIFYLIQMCVQCTMSSPLVAKGIVADMSHFQDHTLCWKKNLNEDLREPNNSKMPKARSKEVNSKANFNGSKYRMESIHEVICQCIIRFIHSIYIPFFGYLAKPTEYTNQMKSAMNKLCDCFVFEIAVTQNSIETFSDFKDSLSYGLFD